MPTIELSGRTTVEVAGPDAEHLLQNVITTDLDELEPGVASAGALLTPQGKILFDFLVSRDGEKGFRLECRSDIAASLIQRLTLYRLRAQADIVERKESLVSVSWQNDSETADNSVLDTRFPASLGVRHAYEPGKPTATGSDENWHLLRIRNGVAESGTDYTLGDAFPHDVLLDQNGGLSFKKGCFVGQEVVSRMQHRGSARRRVLIAGAAADLPAPGTDIVAGSRTIGTLGSICGAEGLVLVRIDRASDALRSGTPILAGTAPIELSAPPGTSFSFPLGDKAAPDA